MKKFVLFWGVVFSFYIILAGGASDAAIYKYVDKEGVSCFADDLQSVPEQYRASAIIVEGEAKDDKANPPPPVTVQNAESPAAETGSSGGPSPLSVRLAISAAVAAAAVALFLIIRRLPGLKDNKKALLAVRASLIGVVAVYLAIVHARDVKTLFGVASQTIEDARQQSAEKGKKAAQAIKSLDAMFEKAQKAQEAEEAGARPEERK